MGTDDVEGFSVGTDAVTVCSVGTDAVTGLSLVTDAVTESVTNADVYFFSKLFTLFSIAF